MYTLEQLQKKSLKELKEIGWQLNVLPAGDRRCRQNWIDAIVGVNPPLLQLLETSPADDVQAQESPIIETVEASSAADDVQAQEPPIESKFGRIVYPRPAQKAIVQAAKTSPGVEVDPVQKPIIETVEASPGVEVDRVQGAIEVQVLEPISQVAKTSPGVEVNQSPECAECFGDGYFEDEWGLIKFCHCSDSEQKLSCQITQSAIAPAAKKLSGNRSKTSTAHQLLELFKSSAQILEPIENSPGVETEATVIQSAITPAAKISLNAESDRNPILTGIVASDRFLARYSPPQPENIRFQVGDDGQLSLLDFEVQSEPESPDPDDFESLDAFREAIALWDAQNPEPPAVSIASMCEWAPCPEEWYEPKAENLPLIASSMMELSPPSAIESSITCNFSIPTFDAWCDRANRQTDTNEPPDTWGIFARLPGPKPPKFPPRAASASQPQVRHKLDTTWTQLGHPKSVQVRLSQRIPKLFHCGVAGSSTQPARSPPGGDA